jgi:hypothetical protein
MDPSEPRGQPETDTGSEAELKNCEANKHVDLQRCIEFFFLIWMVGRATCAWLAPDHVRPLPCALASRRTPYPAWDPATNTPGTCFCSPAVPSIVPAGFVHDRMILCPIDLMDDRRRPPEHACSGRVCVHYSPHARWNSGQSLGGRSNRSSSITHLTSSRQVVR